MKKEKYGRFATLLFLCMILTACGSSTSDYTPESAQALAEAHRGSVSEISGSGKAVVYGEGAKETEVLETESLEEKLDTQHEEKTNTKKKSGSSNSVYAAENAPSKSSFNSFIRETIQAIRGVRSAQRTTLSSSDKEILYNGINSTADSIDNARNNMASQAESAVNDLINQANSTVSNAKDEAEHAVSDAKNEAEQAVNDAKNEAEQAANDLKNEVEHTVNDSINQIENAANNASNAIKDKIEQGKKPDSTETPEQAENPEQAEKPESTEVPASPESQNPAPELTPSTETPSTETP